MENLRGALIGFITFLVVCVIALVGVIVVFGQFRFDDQSGYSARFSNITGLKVDDFVRIAGVEVGKVKSLDLQPDNSIVVGFGVDKDVQLTDATTAQVRYENLVGDRYLALSEGAGDTITEKSGYRIPLNQTSPALDLDALLGGFRPLFRALDPDQVNDLTGQLISVFQGEGGNIASVLQQTATLTSTLADRDQLIGSVISNLNVVLGTLADRGDQLDNGIVKLSQVVRSLAAAPDFGGSVANISRASGTVADLLMQARPPLKNIVAQTDRAAGRIMSDSKYFDNLIGSLPNAYAILGRQGLYGDFFSFYLCNAALKVNGPDGNPVTITLAGQTTGRCAPR